MKVYWPNRDSLIWRRALDSVIEKKYGASFVRISMSKIRLSQILRILHHGNFEHLGCEIQKLTISKGQMASYKRYSV